APGAGRTDEVDDGFSLGEVEPAVEKGAQGEFAGLGGTGARAEHFPEHAGGEEASAVALNLDDVLAGVGARGAHHGDEGLIERAALPVYNPPEDQRVAPRLGQGFRKA